MSQKMLINARDPEELRAALVEDGVLEAFYVEAMEARQTRGNIYKGVVSNIEPSLDAAFIDYGQARHGFLQADELEPGLWKNGQNKRPPIQEVLRKGQQLLVQVVKEPQGTKGSALTTYLSIPGQSLVLTMGRHLSGVSRKVVDESERKRLKQTITSFNMPDNMGIIARTAALGRTKRELQSTVKQLLRVFDDVLKRGKSAPSLSLVRQEESLAVRTVRDLFTSEVDEILVDEVTVYEQLKDFLALVNPKRQKALHLYQDVRPIFSKYNLEKQIQSIFLPRVELKSGAGLVINQTEALVSIDVNSGKAIKGKQIEDTALSVNMEAAREIARQLRLRDLGGLVVVDFIDMRDAKHQLKVQKELKEALKKDKAKVDVGRISRFGLLELSRQRIRPSIEFGATCTCPLCQGRGVVRTLEASARQLWRGMAGKLGEKSCSLALNPEMAAYMLNQQRAKLAALEIANNICIEVKPDPALALDAWRIEPLAREWLRPENGYKPAERPETSRPTATAKADDKPVAEEKTDKPARPKTSQPKGASRPAKDATGKPSTKEAAGKQPDKNAAGKSEASVSAAQVVEALVAPPTLLVEGNQAKKRPSRRSGSARRRARRQKIAAETAVPSE